MRIFITAGGTVTAQSLIKALRSDHREHTIVVGDMDVMNATKAFADAFVTLPRADDASFADACLDAALQNRIELLIPLIVEREFLPLARRREELAKIGCRLWVPPEELINTIGDKLEFSKFLTRIGVRCPRTVAYSSDVQIDRFPVFLKPRRGSGSVGTQRVSSLATLHEAAQGRSDLIVQEALDGTEFTVDCFAAAPGMVVAAIPRERIAVKAGVSVKGRTYHHREIEDLCTYVVERSGVVGPANVQGILLRDGFSIVEMNPRFSGTLALSTAAGINFGSLLIDVVEGNRIPNFRGCHRAGVSMMRYWQEVFEADGMVWLGETMERKPTLLHS
jgi:carbamoyl-phosphate synthase large subunit